MMRMARLALATGLALAPGLAGAQGSDQLAPLQKAIRICTDPAVMPDDWAAALDGWTEVDATEQLIRYYVAARVVQSASEGRGASTGLSSAEFADRLAEMSRDLEHRMSDADYSHPTEEYDIRFYQHPSGWLLRLTIDAEDPVYSECNLFHDEPDEELIAYLARPYMTVRPRATFLGPTLDVETYVPDPSGETANVGYHLFLLDPEQPTPEIAADIDPLHHSAAVSFLAGVFAPGREVAE